MPLHIILRYSHHHEPMAGGKSLHLFCAYGTQHVSHITSGHITLSNSNTEHQLIDSSKNIPMYALKTRRDSHETVSRIVGP